MRPILFLLALALALPAAGQGAHPARKRTPHAVAHTRPTPRQIREFDALEKKEETAQERKIRGRSPNSKTARAPSPK